MLPILLAVSLCTIVCLTVVSLSDGKMRRTASEPSLAELAAREVPPPASRHRNISASVSVPDERRGCAAELSEPDSAGDAEVPEHRVEFGQWKEGQNEGEKIRKVSYHVQLNNPLGPKTALCTQDQVLDKATRPGHLYAVNCEVTAHGIPYGDNFSVLLHFCMTRISPSQSSLLLFGQIKYKKSTWGLIKNFIEKNTNSGMDEHYGQLVSELLRVTGEEMSRKARVRGRRISIRDSYATGDALSPESPLAQVPSRPRLMLAYTLGREASDSSSSRDGDGHEMLPILLAVSLCTIVCLTVVSLSDGKMRRTASEPSLAELAAREVPPPASRHRNISASVSVPDERRGCDAELSEPDSAGDAEVPEHHIEYGQWKEGENEGEKIRKLSYHVQLNNPLGPKTALCTQDQVLDKATRPGHLYAVNCEVTAHGIPYGDNFSVLLHFCMTRISPSQSSLLLFGQIKYKKSTWGLIKNFIEKNTNSGMGEYYGQLVSELLRVTGEEMSRKARVRGRRISIRDSYETGDALSPESPLVQVPSRPRLSEIRRPLVLDKATRPGHLYAVNCEVTAHGIPYGDNFSVLLHFCMTRISPSQSSLLLFGQIKYKKSTWGLIKNFIEKNTNSGMDEHYGQLVSELLRVTGEEMSRKARVRGRRISIRDSYATGDALSPESPLAQVPSRPRLSEIRRPL
ncbi:unnamed protein product, partial [Darwinula stevensoni]